MDAGVVLHGTKEQATNLLVNKFLYGGIVPGVEKNSKPIVVSLNCYRVEREPLPAVNFMDFIVNLDHNIALKYKIRTGDLENPICTYEIDYFMYDNGDGTTTCRRHVYNFVQRANPDLDYSERLATNLPIENQKMADVCQELKK